MRSSAALLKRQDVCFHCAFRLRYGAERPVRRSRAEQPIRSYRISMPFSKPTGAAVAPKEEEEEDDYPALPSTLLFQPPPGDNLPAPPPKRLPGAPNPYESMPDWSCRCGHVNLSNRSQCSICDEPRRPDAKLHYPPKIPLKDYRRLDRSDRGATLRPEDRGSPSRASSDLSVRRPRGDRGAYAPREQPASNRFMPITWTSTDSGANSQKSRFSFPDRTSEYRSHRSRNHFRQNSFSFNPGAGPGPTHSQQPSPGRDQFSGFRRRNDSVASSSGTSQFMPFTIRKFKPKDDNESTRLQDTSRGRPPVQGDPVTDIDAGTVATFLPPASSSFDNYADERRKKRNDRFERRSERYEIDDADGDTSQTSNNRDKGLKPRRSAQREIDEETLLLEYELQEEGRQKRVPKSKTTVLQAKPKLQLPDFISVEQLSRILKVRVDPFLRKLEEEGFEGARYDHILDAESSAMIADMYGLEASFGGRQTFEDMMPQPAAEDKSLLPPRPPVVTIMGHVDHGKTTILDWLRKSSVVASEHGGITQHIGAFSVTMPGSERQITFLDTPGHAAFLDMRRRGAVVTDIVVLVVAADDSVKPQTVEAIKHALEAKVHIIVAINKVDKQDSNVERVKQDLARNDITVEEYGGEYQAIALSGKTGQGMEELEEAILTLADVSDFRAETDGQAEGWILESTVTPAGRVATILVRRGTLRVGDFIVAGTTWARVRTLRNDAGMLVEEALPGTPVQVDGWRGEDPTAGLEVLQAENEEHAKDVVDIRLERIESMRIAGDLTAMNASRTEEAEARAKVLAWEAEQSWAKKKRKPTDNEGWVEAAASKGAKHVHFVVKADVAGSVEALVAAVSAVGNNEVRANIIHSGTGLLSESDIRLLAATGETAYAMSFNQPVESTISQLARAAGVQILDHNIIYKVTDDVKEKLSAELPPLVTQRVLGEAELGKIFEITTKKGKVKIAGCKINNGLVSRSHKIRVLRDGETVYTGKLDSLKNVKKDVMEMRKGSECGMGFSDWEDFKEGDQIQTYEEERTPRKLY
jgi:translation initiation factor IF-2